MNEFKARVCIAPMDIASYYAGLKLGFDQIGVKSVFYDFDRNPYSRYRPGPNATFLERLIYCFSGMSRQGSIVYRIVRRSIETCLRLIAFITAVATCDAFIFAFGKTFFSRWDLPFLRLMGKRIIFVFHGSDTRPAWMSGLSIHGDKALTAEGAARLVRCQARMLRWIERFSSASIDHPLSAQLHRGPFINHLHIGHPTPTLGADVAPVTPRGSAVRIVHAPSRPQHKGSAEIRSAVETLRQEGHAIDFVELIGRPNSEVLASIASCDLVVDELYSDIPLAGLGSEAAQAGKPALVCGYGAAELARQSAGTGLPLALYAHPARIVDMLRTLVTNREMRHRAGSDALRFIRDKWDHRLVARRLMMIIQNRIPPAWIVDPAGLRYWQGWGAPQEKVADYVAEMVDRCGIRSLRIGHNPRLQAIILDAIAARAVRG